MNDMFASSAPPVLKVCTVCARSLPAEQFRPRTDRPGKRRTECRQCWARYIRSYRAGRRDRLIRDFCRRAANAKSQRQAVQLAHQLARRFGVERFATLLVEYTCQLASRRPGCAGVLTALKALSRIGFS